MTIITNSNFDFGNYSQLYGLKSLLSSTTTSDTSGSLTAWEKGVLNGQLNKMIMAGSPVAAQAAFQGYLSLQSELSGNEFEVQAVTQKNDAVAPAGTKESLQTVIFQRKSLVDYLSQFGGANGTAYLNAAELTTLRGYLEKAQDLLTQYARTDLIGGTARGLTAAEAAEVMAAVEGPPAPANPVGGVSLMQRVLDYRIA